MSDEMIIGAEKEEANPLPLLLQVKYGISTLVGTEILCAHFGPTGIAAGIVAGWLASQCGPEIHAGIQRKYASLDPKSKMVIHDAYCKIQEMRGLSLLPDETLLLEEGSAVEGDVQRTLPTKDESGYVWDYNDDEDGMPSLSTSSGKFLFSDILAEGFVPSLHKIFIGRLTDGTPIYVEAKDLCHVALAGSTGNGKSSLMRLLMAQLCKVGARVLLLNPHYMRYEHDSGEDWTPFDPFLEQTAHDCSQYAHMERLLKHIVEKTLPDRIERAYHGDPVGRPYFIVIDELPAIVAELPNAPGYIAKLLREGRKYGIFLIVASQDFLVKTTGMDGGGVRQCFRTACYVGGDATTAKVLLARQKDDAPIHESDLGKGTIMLRCKATGKAVIAKVPYVDNDSLYRLLGPSTFTAPTTPQRLPKQGITEGVVGSPALTPLPPNPRIPTGVVGESLGSRYERSTGELTGYSRNAVSVPVVPVGVTPVHSPFTKEDRVMNDEQITQFVALYPVIGNIQKCLAKIEGCSNRYSKHAGMIVKERALKKKGA